MSAPTALGMSQTTIAATASPTALMSPRWGRAIQQTAMARSGQAMKANPASPEPAVDRPHCRAPEAPPSSSLESCGLLVRTRETAARSSRRRDRQPSETGSRAMGAQSCSSSGSPATRGSWIESTNSVAIESSGATVSAKSVIVSGPACVAPKPRTLRHEVKKGRKAFNGEPMRSRHEKSWRSLCRTIVACGGGYHFPRRGRKARRSP